MTNKTEERAILVVDDEESMRIALSEALVRGGHQVDCVTNGYDALTRVSSESFKLIITDVRMPKMDGLQVLQEIKKVSPRTPVIVITAYGAVQNAVDAMRRGAADYILKPFSFDDLSTAVKRALVNANGQNGGCVQDDQRVREIVTKDPQMLKCITMAKNVALSRSTVLIQGESGTGKELFARYIHQHSECGDKDLVAINCAAIPENLLESELFGYEKGAFTGAASKRLGKFELAQGSTLLLDEVGEMGLTLQAKLLRVLQEFEIDRVGGKEPVPIDVRVIATTNVELQQAVDEGKFREDLFYRLNVIPLKIPPLRKRKDDIPPLAEHFVQKHSLRCKKEVPEISPELFTVLKDYEWRGNVRELENVIERTVLLHRDGMLLPQHLVIEEDNGMATSHVSKGGKTMKEMEKTLIMETLEELEGNRTHAAEALGISIRTLRNKLSEYKKQGELHD